MISDPSGPSGASGASGQSGPAGASGPAGPRRCAAVVLAGGQARRLGGGDKPGLRIAGRSLAAAAAIAAYGAGAAKIIYVGPPRPELLAELAEPGLAGTGLAGPALPEPALPEPGLAGPGPGPGLVGTALAGAVPAGAVEFAREDPPGGGPIPALRAGLARVGEPWVLLLAADLPFLTSGQLRELLAAAIAPVLGGAEPGAVVPGAAVLADDQGRPQWLSSCWRTADLCAALAEYQGASLRGLLGAMPHILVAATVEPGRPPYWLDCDTPADIEAAQRWIAGSL